VTVRNRAECCSRQAQGCVVSVHMGRKDYCVCGCIHTQDATLNAAAGKYEGMDRFEARKALWADIEAQGLAIKKENYTIRYKSVREVVGVFLCVFVS